MEITGISLCGMSNKAINHRGTTFRQWQEIVDNDNSFRGNAVISFLCINNMLFQNMPNLIEGLAWDKFVFMSLKKRHLFIRDR